MFTIDCSGVETEGQFWDRYLAGSDPAEREDFGRNLDAFWDAVQGGGPGAPGGQVVRFINSGVLRSLQGGAFLEALLEIAKDATTTHISFV